MKKKIIIKHLNESRLHLTKWVQTFFRIRFVEFITNIL